MFTSVSSPGRAPGTASAPGRLAGLAGNPVAAWAATAGRLALAGVFAYAGLTKIGDPAGTVRSVQAYQLLPDGLATAVGRGLPALELALAVALLLGSALRLTAAVAAGLLAVFTAGVASAWARGLQIDCGCFGSGGPTADPRYAAELARDGALLILAVGLALVGRSRLAAGPRRPAAGPAMGTGGRAERVAEQRRRVALEAYGRSRRRLAAGTAAVLLLAGPAGVVVNAVAADGPPAAVPAGVTEAGGIVVGSADAPRTLVVYEDPQCPACGLFERAGGEVLAAAVASGAVKVEYRMRSFLGPESVRAAAALGAAQDAGRFDELRRLLFSHQPEEHAGGYTVDDLLALGARAGLTGEAFVRAVREQTYAPWARAVDARASRDGNTSTPQLILDGRTLAGETVFDPDAFGAALDPTPPGRVGG